MEKASPQNFVPETKTINYADQIQSILTDKHPLDKLNQISSQVNFFLEYNTSIKLKKESDMNQLIYSCLPTLNTILQEVKGLGINDQELVTIGFEELIETIEDWEPKENNPKQNDNLKWKVNTITKRKVKEFIASEYGLNQRHFDLIPIYFQAQNEYQRIYDKTPKSNNWEILNEIIDEQIQKLPEDKNKYIQSLRYVTKTKDNFNDTENITIDLFHTIHDQVDKKRPLSQKNVSLDDEINLILLKKEITEILPTLTPKKQKIIEMHFGLNGESENSLKEIGKKFNINGNRICQIESNALRNLRHPSRAKKLRPFLSDD